MVDVGRNGPYAWNLIIDSSDPNVIPKFFSTATFSLSLNKAIELTSGTWQVGVSRLIFKPAIKNLRNATIDRTVYCNLLGGQTTSFTLPEVYVKNLTQLLGLLNDSIPANLKGNLTFKYDSGVERLYVVANKLNVHVESVYFSNVLGFQAGNLYPRAIPSTETGAYGAYAPNLWAGCEIFHVGLDIIVPQIHSSQYSNILLSDVITHDVFDVVTRYKYSNPKYVEVVRNNFSTIQISLLDNYKQPLQLADPRYPIIIDLHFRKCINLLE